MTPAQMHMTITLMGWRQCGRAYYKLLADGYLHASISYHCACRVYADVENQGWAEPLPMSDARIAQLFATVMRYEKEGLVQL